MIVCRYLYYIWHDIKSNVRQRLANSFYRGFLTTKQTWIWMEYLHLIDLVHIPMWVSCATERKRMIATLSPQSEKSIERHFDIHLCIQKPHDLTNPLRAEQTLRMICKNIESSSDVICTRLFLHLVTWKHSEQQSLGSLLINSDLFVHKPFLV